MKSGLKKSVFVASKKSAAFLKKSVFDASKKSVAFLKKNWKLLLLLVAAQSLLLGLLPLLTYSEEDNLYDRPCLAYLLHLHTFLLYNLLLGAATLLRLLLSLPLLLTVQVRLLLLPPSSSLSRPPPSSAGCLVVMLLQL